MKANYTEPKVSPKDYDMSKEWFIYFRWTDPETGKRIPVKKRADLNSIHDKTERLRSALNLAEVYFDLLKNGWTPESEKIAQVEVKEIKEDKTLIQWLDSILLTKKSLKTKSFTDYEDIIKIFKAWLIKTGRDNIKVEEFTNEIAIQYLDYCVIERENSGRTRNNQMSAMKTFFYDIFKREKTKYKDLINPFSGIIKLPEREGNNYALTKEERAQLKEYLYPKYKEFYFACCFMFYCCLRRPDIANIKFKDIDRKNMVLITHSGSAKSLRQEAVRIPKAMNPILDEMQIDKYPGTWYIFSQKFKPGPEKIRRLGDFTEFFRKHADIIGIDPVKSFYSYKHSGACAYYELTGDLIAVMYHLRHTEPTVTMKYLRSLGQMVDDKIKNSAIEM